MKDFFYQGERATTPVSLGHFTQALSVPPIEPQ
jgi:hypothetical protein